MIKTALEQFVRYDRKAVSMANPRGIVALKGEGDYKALHEERMGPRVHPGTEGLRAYVNHGRWLVDCTCNTGCGAIPGVGEVRCFGCGAVHQGTVFPAEVEEIEAALEPREEYHQHWVPGQTVGELLVENLDRGIA